MTTLDLAALKRVAEAATQGALDRFWSKVDKQDERGCLCWLGGKTKKGYGCFYFEGKLRLAHRWIFEQWHGHLKPKEMVCHSCDNPSCVNLTHLYRGNNSINMRDCHSKGRMHHQLHPDEILRGSKHGNAKLTEEDVRNIKNRANSGETQLQISLGYGIARTTVNRIVTGKGWKHVRP